MARRRLAGLVVVGAVLVTGWSLGSARDDTARSTAATPRARDGAGAIGTLRTSRVELDRTVAAMRAALQRDPANAAAAVRLADAWLRLVRVTGNAGLAHEAERVLLRARVAAPDATAVPQMLGAVYLSQHRFTDAVTLARAIIAAHPHDAWAFGVLGDGLLELGDREAAFDAFDRMLALRPDAASYGRAAYARELLGDLRGAVTLMQMALDATSPHDPESLAWHHAQLGNLFLRSGDLAAARRSFAHADFVFPGHPLAIEGEARLLHRDGRHADALARLQPLLDTSPTSDRLTFAAELLNAAGRDDDAHRYRALAAAARAAEEVSR